jgi:hypothetical protein
MEYVIRKVHGNQVGLKLTGTHQLLAHAVDVNVLGDNIVNKGKHSDLNGASKDVGLEINLGNTKYMLSSHQNASQNRDIKT